MERSVDVVVGVCTKNCADTVASVIKTVDRGLARFFPEKRSLIIVSDGFSTDGTQEKARTVETETEIVVTPQNGGQGRGMESGRSLRSRGIAVPPQSPWSMVT